MRTWLLTILATLALSSTANAGVYGFGLGFDYGKTYMPETADSHSITTFSYREHAGIIGNTLLFLVMIPPSPGGSRTYNETTCTGDGNTKVCSTYEVTETKVVTPEQQAAYAKEVEEYFKTTGPAILRGDLHQEVQIDIASRSLGGSASGAMVKLLFNPSGVLAGGLGVGKYTFHDVKRQQVVAENGMLRSDEVIKDHDYFYIGIPIRFQLPINETGFGVMAQFDFNIASLFEDASSPIRAGVTWIGPHIILNLEGSVSGFAPTGAGVHLEAILAI